MNIYYFLVLWEINIYVFGKTMSHLRHNVVSVTLLYDSRRKNITLFETHRDKFCLRGFGQCQTQIRLCSHGTQSYIERDLTVRIRPWADYFEMLSNMITITFNFMIND